MIVMIKRKNALLILLGLSLTFSSCEKFRKSIQDTKAGPVLDNKASRSGTQDTGVVSEQTRESQEEKRGFAGDVSELRHAEELLRNLPKLKGRKVAVYQSIHFYDDYRILLRIQNPDTLKYVDEYYYRNGIWEGPSPLVLSKSVDVEKDLVSLDKIPFKNAAHVYQAMKEKMTEIGSRSTDYTVYVVTYNNKIRWYPRTISNTRERFSIEYNEDGTLRSFEQD